MNETARIEAFSDGIFSIAATLLVLELKHPAANLPFWQGIAQLWPGYVSFVLSFFFIGIMWINHHRLFVHIKKADDVLMTANLLLLLGVVFVPYPTSLMAASITALDSTYARNVAIFYNATYLFIALLFNLLGYVCEHRHLLDDDAEPRSEDGSGQGVNHGLGHAAFDRYFWGPIWYSICVAVTWWSVPVSLAINAGMAIYFLLPAHRRTGAHPHAH